MNLTCPNDLSALGSLWVAATGVESLSATTVSRSRSGARHLTESVAVPLGGDADTLPECL